MQLPSLEEPGNWTRKDVYPGSVMWSTLTPASLGRGLQLEPSLPVPLAVVLRARLPGLCVCACVCAWSLSPALSYPHYHSPPFLSLSSVNSIKINILGSHFIFVFVPVCM